MLVRPGSLTPFQIYTKMAGPLLNAAAMLTAEARVHLQLASGPNEAIAGERRKSCEKTPQDAAQRSET